LDIKPIAFYLPQFHPVKENSEWWGEGFTEWVNVAKAQPNFEGHYQPHIPKHLGFYDLRLLEVMKSQVKLAQTFGIFGFCFYHYWFGGRRILELPVNNFINSDIDFPFCLCWANENWTRRWDGGDHEILIQQEYTPENDLQFIKDLLPFLNDARYIRVDGKPMILVYRAGDLSNASLTAALWRDEASKAGLGGLHLVSVASNWTPMTNPSEYGFDALVEFPPHGFFVGIDQRPVRTNENSKEHQYFDYEKVVSMSLDRNIPPFPFYRGIMPSWDNTARRQNNGATFINSSPAAYLEWLTRLVSYTKNNLPADRRFIFINAWNEWAEGAHLEPDLKYDLAFLIATQQALIDGQSV
jgi:lipopolysaccharide biosynthesis protein